MVRWKQIVVEKECSGTGSARRLKFVRIRIDGGPDECAVEEGGLAVRCPLNSKVRLRVGERQNRESEPLPHRDHCLFCLGSDTVGRAISGARKIRGDECDPV